MSYELLPPAVVVLFFGLLLLASWQPGTPYRASPAAAIRWTPPPAPTPPILSAPRVSAGRVAPCWQPPAGYASPWDRLVNDTLGRRSFDQAARQCAYPSGTPVRLSSWDS